MKIVLNYLINNYGEHNIIYDGYQKFNKLNSINFYRIYKKSYKWYIPNEIIKEMENRLNFKKPVYCLIFNEDNKNYSIYYKNLLKFLRAENINFTIFQNGKINRYIYINGINKDKNINFIDKKINIFDRNYKQKRYIYI